MRYCHSLKLNIYVMRVNAFILKMYKKPFSGCLKKIEKGQL